jgi:hypothetical protein
VTVQVLFQVRRIPMITYHIGADVDSRITELAVLGGRAIKYFTVPTTIPPLLEVLKSIPGRKVLVMEEGPMADWLCRRLRRCGNDELQGVRRNPLSGRRTPVEDAPSKSNDDRWGAVRIVLTSCSS